MAVAKNSNAGASKDSQTILNVVTFNPNALYPGSRKR